MDGPSTPVITEEVISILGDAGAWEPLDEAVLGDGEILKNSPLSNEVVAACLDTNILGRDSMLASDDNIGASELDPSDVVGIEDDPNIYEGDSMLANYDNNEVCTDMDTRGEDFSEVAGSEDEAFIHGRDSMLTGDDTGGVSEVEMDANDGDGSDPVGNGGDGNIQEAESLLAGEVASGVAVAEVDTGTRAGGAGREKYSRQSNTKPYRGLPAVSNRVKDYFRKNPDYTMRRCALDLNLARSTIRKIVADLKYKEPALYNRIYRIKGPGEGDGLPKGQEKHNNNTAGGSTPSTVRSVKEKHSDKSDKKAETPKANPFKQLNPGILGSVFCCLDFTAQKLRNQVNKELDFTPLINYPIGVANVLVQEGGIEDVDVIQAAILQKTLESGETYFGEISSCFNPQVATIVAELVLDRRISVEERRETELQNAPKKTKPAQLIGMASMIYELRGYARTLPPGWNARTRRDYFSWAKEVVQHYYPANDGMASALRKLFRQIRA